MIDAQFTLEDSFSYHKWLIFRLNIPSFARALIQPKNLAWLEMQISQSSICKKNLYLGIRQNFINFFFSEGQYIL